jgi:hypothetical protein
VVHHQCCGLHLHELTRRAHGAAKQQTNRDFMIRLAQAGHSVRIFVVLNLCLFAATSER